MGSQKRERCKELMKSTEIYLKRLPTTEDFEYYINNIWTNSDGLVKLKSSPKIHESSKFLINQARKPFLFVTSNRGILALERKKSCCCCCCGCCHHQSFTPFSMIWKCVYHGAYTACIYVLCTRCPLLWYNFALSILNVSK